MLQTDDLAATIPVAAKTATSRVDLWRRLLRAMQPKAVMEVGVWKGEYAAEILKDAPSIEKYYMLDAWRPMADWNKPFNVSSADFEAVFEAAMAATAFAGDRRIVLRGATVEVVDRLADDSVDFVYIDGDHTLRGICVDLINCYRKTAVGGWIGGDDFHASIWQHDTRYEPTLIFPFAVYFAQAVGAPIYALPFSQFLLHKPEAGARRFCFDDLTGRYKAQDLLSQLSLRKIVGQNVTKTVPGIGRGYLRKWLGRRA